MGFYASYPTSGSGGGGVTSLDSMTGDINIVAGSGISVVDSPGTITISATGSGSETVELRTLSAPEAAAEQITLAGTPTTPNFTILLIAGAPNQFYGADFTVSGNILSWAGLGLSGILSTGDQLTIQYN